MTELRHALRQLRRSPGFSAAVVATLALGIGVTTTLFSVTRSVLLDPLPYGEPDRAVVLWSGWSDFPKTWVSYDEVEAYSAEIDAFDEVGMFMDGRGNLTGNEAPERIRFAGVTENVFRILGVEPMLGRAFLQQEDMPGGEAVIVLGHGLWQRRFAGDPSVVGHTLELNGTSRRIVGVMPTGFKLPLDFGADGATEAWIPLAVDPLAFGAVPGPGMAQNGGSHTFYGLARLAQGATAERANRELRALTDRWNAEGVYQEGWNFQATAVPVADEITGELRPALLIMMAAVTLLLLLACANVASLLLIRGEDRRLELGVRVALGAGGGRLVRQFFAEAGVLALIGGAAGVALAWLGVAAARAGAPASLPRISEAQLGLTALGFAVTATVAATLLSGLAPALRARHADPAGSLGGASRGGTAAKGQTRLRSILVAGQVAAAVVLTVGAGLMARTVSQLLAVDPGFRTEGQLTLEVSAPSSDYPDPADVAGFFDEFRRRVATLPGVRSVGAARVLPLASEIGNTGLHVEGYDPPPGQGSPGDWQVVTPGYMEAVGLRLLEGRLPNEGDGADGAPILVINRTMAERYFAGRNPIGGRIRLGFGGPESPWSTVVGVVDDVRHDGLTAEVRPKYYAVHSQFPVSAGFAPRTMTLVVEAEGEAVALAGPVVAELRALDPRIPASRVRPMREVAREATAQPRFTFLLLLTFGGMALSLAALGVHAVVAHAVVTRRREMGIRMALGASPAALVRLAVRGGMIPAGAGAAVGLVASGALAGVMGGLLYGIGPLDPATFGTALAVVCGAAALAALVPALRIGRIEPAATLREE